MMYVLVHPAYIYMGLDQPHPGSLQTPAHLCDVCVYIIIIIVPILISSNQRVFVCVVHAPISCRNNNKN